MTDMEHVCTTPEELQALAEQFAIGLRPGDHLGLVGGLGAGKTTFVQGLARGLGCDALPDSPTFTLRQSLHCASATGIQELVHVDLYRLDEPEAIQELGLADDLVDPKTLLAIEWIDRAPELGAKLRYRLEFTWNQHESVRRVRIIDQQLTGQNND